MFKLSFDNQKYLSIQSTYIMERIKQFDNKLYLEFGGKLFDDEHASRVLPGFQPDSKLKMLLQVKDEVEILISVNANDIENNKQRKDLEIGYDLEVFRLIDSFRSVGLYVGSVVITQFNNQDAALKFRKKLKDRGIKTFVHYKIEGYPHALDHIVSDEGYGKNEYVETTKPLVVVTAPGPGSGKMATCLSQLYHEHKRGVRAGYAKFETFPVWNLPLKHPVNLAYEAATADLNDINMIDPFHLEAYQKIAINYNRDIEVFPILKDMLERIFGQCPYKSPTDMGVNCAGLCIIDDENAKKASKDEILRRYYQALVDFKEGKCEAKVLDKLELLLTQSGVKKEDRPVIKAALDKSEESQEQSFALELNDGHIITGRRTPLLGAPAACLLNALKYLAKIDDGIFLIAPSVLEPIINLKTKDLGNKNPRLHLDEVLIALSISATTNPLSHVAMLQLKNLNWTEAHSSVILDAVDFNVLRKLKIHVTCQPQFRTKSLYRAE